MTNFNSGHLPVLWSEVLDAFVSFVEQKKSSVKYLDACFGRGGHYSLLEKRIPGLQTLAFDQDLEAVKYAQQQFPELLASGKLQIIHDNFVNFSSYTTEKFDMILLDLGVSSPQLDQAHRGFSFYQDGPLDMRMNQNENVTAKDLLHELSEKELIHLFQEYGEVRSPFRVVRAIVHDRKTKKFDSTKDLASLIERVDRWRHKGKHPATQYFMALRIAVNRELDVLQKTLPEMMTSLNPGGRIAVISFHSLEDRIVKNIFKSHVEFGSLINKKVIVASDAESEINPRSRSAKLRIFERGAI